MRSRPALHLEPRDFGVARPFPEALREPHLETERRLDGGYHLQQRVGRERQLLHLGVAVRAPLHVGERVGPLPAGRDPEGELGELVRVPGALGPGTQLS